MSGALRAEWTKARSLPSTWWLLAGTVVAMVALALAVTGTVRLDDCGEGTCTVDTVRLSLAGARLAQVGTAVLGALLVTGEYATGTITATLVAVPRRARVLAAKAAVLVALVGSAGVVGVVASRLAARTVLPRRGFTAATGYVATTLTRDLTQRAAVGTVVYLVLVALLGAGLGLAIRDTGATLTVVLAVLLVAPMAATFVSNPLWRTRIHRFAPMDAGLAVQATRDLAALPVAPWQGLALLGAYAVAALAAGGVLLRLRDATR